METDFPMNGTPNRILGGLREEELKEVGILLINHLGSSECSISRNTERIHHSAKTGKVKQSKILETGERSLRLKLAKTLSEVCAGVKILRQNLSLELNESI